MFFITKRYKTNKVRFFRLLLQSPTRISICGFLILISIGTVLLMLPAASTSKSLNLVDALFTATSASCVTGLVVIDTGRSLSRLGQYVILILIQAGGLGIMTISTLFLLIAGRRPSLTGRVVIQDTFTRGGERTVGSILKDVALFTCVFEGLGTVLLFCRFFPERSMGEALYLAVFHAISAFCNAGFSVFADSFAGFGNEWTLNLVICFLIISGGIGFPVLSELKRQWPLNRGKWSRLSLHTKLVLSTTAILLVSSTLCFFLMEWENTLAPLSVPHRFLASFFQTVSARTAGFNTLSIDKMANETLFIFILLMFIGASPGSCGGGIKTSSLATLVLLGLSRLRGQPRPQVFHRTISEASVGKALSLVMVSTVVIVAGTLALLMSELGEIPHYLSRGKFLELFFEVVSAFGTVGLSTGVTTGLSTLGKYIITLTMFVGRIGPLVVALAISRRTTARFYYADENIIVG